MTAVITLWGAELNFLKMKQSAATQWSTFIIVWSYEDMARYSHSVRYSEYEMLNTVW